jgi:hypothetical protein
MLDRLVLAIKMAVKRNSLIAISNSTYKKGSILYFIQADLDTNVDSWYTLGWFTALVNGNNNNFEFWVLPDKSQRKGSLKSKYTNNRIEHYLKKIRIRMLYFY